MLQMNKERFEACQISELERLATPILEHRESLYRRYRRKSEDHCFMSGGDGRSIQPFEFYIVNMMQGYLGGKAPSYSVRKGDKSDAYAEGYLSRIQHIQRYNDDGATYMELMHDYLIMTAAYLYVYESGENEVIYTRLDARQTIAVFDYSTPPNLIGLVRIWREGQDTITERITDAGRQKYRNGKADGEALPHLWGDVPAIAFEQPDTIASFEPVIATIDAYEQITNNIRSMTRYNDNAKLMVSGYQAVNPVGTPGRQQEDEAYYKASTLFLEEGADARWLLKEVDYTGLLSVLKGYHDDITMFTGVPNMTDEAFSSADNASALGYKVYAMDQYSSAADRVFRKGYLRLWEIISDRLNLKGGGYDFRDIDIAMQRNLPTDRDKSLDRAARAYQAGIVSRQTAIEESQIEVDPKDEMQRIQTEEDAAYQTAMTRTRVAAETDTKDDEGEDGGVTYE